jgi:hypothetical protein
MVDTCSRGVKIPLPRSSIHGIMLWYACKLPVRSLLRLTETAAPTRRSRTQGHATFHLCRRTSRETQLSGRKAMGPRDLCWSLPMDVFIVRSDRSSTVGNERGALRPQLPAKPGDRYQYRQLLPKCGSMRFGSSEGNQVRPLRTGRSYAGRVLVGRQDRRQVSGLPLQARHRCVRFPLSDHVCYFG